MSCFWGGCPTWRVKQHAMPSGRSCLLLVCTHWLVSQSNSQSIVFHSLQVTLSGAESQQCLHPHSLFAPLSIGCNLPQIWCSAAVRADTNGSTLAAEATHHEVAHASITSLCFYSAVWCELVSHRVLAHLQVHTSYPVVKAALW